MEPDKCRHEVLSGMNLEPRPTLQLDKEYNVVCYRCGYKWLPENKPLMMATATGPYSNQNPPNWIPNVDPVRGY